MAPQINDDTEWYAHSNIDGLLRVFPVAAFRVVLDGTIGYANPAAEALLQLRTSDMTGRRYDNPPILVTAVDGSALPFEHSPVPRALRGETVAGFEMLAHLHGESRARLLCIDAAPYRDRSGNIAGVVASARDLTEQHTSKEELRLSQQRLNSVLSNTRMSVFVMDEHQHCTYANVAAEQLTGYRFDEMQGRPLHDVVHHTRPDGSHYPLHECPIDRAFPEDFQVDGEEIFVHKDGSFYPVAFTASPIHDNASRTVGTVIEVRSIVDEKQREEERRLSELRIREAEERYRLALLATRDAIWDWDLLQDQVLWNEALQSAHGWALESVDSGSTWWIDHIHPDDQERVSRSIHAVIDGGGISWTDEYRFLTATGNYADILDRGTVLRDEAGQAVRMIGAMLDQTERKQQQAALRESEQTLRSLTEAMPNVAWIANASGTVEWLNGGWYDFAGSEPGADLGGGWHDYLHEDDVGPVQAKWRLAVSSACAFENEQRFRRHDGVFRWFLVRGTPILDGAGNLARWFGTCTDIEDLVSARLVLTRSREELANEVEARTRELDRFWSVSDDLFVVCDLQLHYRNASPAWHDVLGYEIADLLGTSLAAKVDERDIERFALAIATLRQRGMVDDLDLRLRAEDGRANWYTWNFRIGDDVIYGSGRNVNRRIELEHQLRQSQKMETVGKLTGGVAHDFNNLLQVISGNLQLLGRQLAGNAEAELRVRNALAGVGRGAKLANQLLAFGRRQPLEPKVVNVGKLIRGMDDMLRRSLGDAVDVESIVAGGLWSTLVDPAQVENAILNLAINGRDAMDGIGKLTIEAGNAYLDDNYVRAHTEVTAGQYVLVAVTDTGSGMNDEILAQVFEPFFSTKPEGRGTGLGLSMVYGFVKQSHGHIKIYSEPGQGTTVKLYFPRSTAAVAELVDAVEGPITGGSETILVAEDDEEVRATTVELLTTLGYRVLKAKDAESALSIIESGIAIDLLFTDVVMPGNLRSPELARQAKQRLPGISVLFTSGYTENAIVHGGRLDAGVELLSKPYTHEALARKIRHVLANGQQRQVPRGVPVDRLPGACGPDHDRLTVLLVEDDELIACNTHELLRAQCHTVIGASTARQALETLHSVPVHVLITDVGLPDQQGDHLAGLARQAQPDIAIVFATGRDEVDRMPAGAVLLRKPYDEKALAEAVSRARLANAAP